MADNAINTAELVDGAVTTAKIANGAVDSTKMASLDDVVFKDDGGSATITFKTPDVMTSPSFTYTLPEFAGAGDVGKLLTVSSTGVLSWVSHVGSSVNSAEITDGTLVDADFNSSAAVAYSKLDLSGGIVNADISSTAAIAYAKLATLGAGQILAGNAGTPTATTLSGDATINNGSLTIANGAITNAKIAASPAITVTKLGALSSGQVVAGNAGVPTAAAMSGDMSIDNTGSVTIANGVITNGKIAAGTGISYSKLASIPTGSILAGDAGVPTIVPMSGPLPTPESREAGLTIIGDTLSTFSTLRQRGPFTQRDGHNQDIWECIFDLHSVGIKCHFIFIYQSLNFSSHKIINF